MKQKTIHLPSDQFCVRDGRVHVWKQDPAWKPTRFIEERYNEPIGDGHYETAVEIVPDPYEMPAYCWQPTNYRVGARCVLASVTNVSPNAIRAGENNPDFYLVFDEDGIGGNSKPQIKRLHGWRGTTNDRSVDAHGLREIVSVRALKNGDVAVTVGPDVASNEK